MQVSNRKAETMTPCLDRAGVQPPPGTRPIARLMTHLIDYAGLFPPAALRMTSALNNYATYSLGENAWALRHFIVNASRLDEFESDVREYLPALSNEHPWQLSALCGPALEDDFRAIEAFNERHSAIQVAAVEIKVSRADDVAPCASGVPKGLQSWFEFPLSADPIPFVHALASAGARAKVRTGGTAANVFPSTQDVCAFLVACCRYNVPFKATAGLHHPFCGTYRLSYEKSDARTTVMYGFLNLFLGATFLYAGIRPELLPDLLGEGSPDAFTFDENGVSWRHHWASNDQIDEARACFAIAFGSCSFDEPLRALRHLNLL